MKVTKAQAQENRKHIVETAATLFRKHGFDGVGVADLMAAARFTHGGFYKHFNSKADLMAEASAIDLDTRHTQYSDLSDFFTQYLSRAHRDDRSHGCTLAALCGDAARQPATIKNMFATGIERLLTCLEHEQATTDHESQQDIRATIISLFAHAIGAVVLSRACPDDSPLADEILNVCLKEILASLSTSTMR